MATCCIQSNATRDDVSIFLKSLSSAVRSVQALLRCAGDKRTDEWVFQEKLQPYSEELASQCVLKRHNGCEHAALAVPDAPTNQREPW